MKIQDSGQCDISVAWNSDLDLILSACGYEARAVHLATNSVGIESTPRRIAIPFMGEKVLDREKNEEIFLATGFRMTDLVSESDSTTPFNIIHQELSEIASAGKKKVRIAIDYSCMTRAWYGAFVNLLFAFKSTIEELEVFFCYSPASYSPPSPVGPNALMGPLGGFRSLKSVNLPVALIIGLGYDRIRAAGLREYVDPARTLAFYTDPPLDKRFLETVLRNNERLLRSIPKSDQIPHSLTDLDATAFLLHNTTIDLAKTYRVVVAPLGVKPFSLLSMLLAARYQEFDVWRVSGCGLTPPSQREAAGVILVYRLLLR